jgi:Trypsin-co-occurring domain 1
MAREPRVVPIIVKEGAAPVWTEVSPDDPGFADHEWVFVARRDEAEKDVPRTMEDAVERIKPLASVLFEKLSTVARPPKEIELTLGLKLSGSVGIIVAQSTGEASLTVTLRWAD